MDGSRKNRSLDPGRRHGDSFFWHCQSKFVYFAKTSEPDFAAIDFTAFFRVDLSGSMAAPSIWNFALTTPLDLPGRNLVAGKKVPRHEGLRRGFRF
jgi:hypothetical protein